MILEAAYTPEVTDDERLPVEPLMAFLGYWQNRHPGDSVRALCARAGDHIRDLDRACDVGRVSIRFVDALLVAAEEPPDVLRELYPVTIKTGGV